MLPTEQAGSSVNAANEEASLARSRKTALNAARLFVQDRLDDQGHVTHKQISFCVDAASFGTWTNIPIVARRDLVTLLENEFAGVLK